MMLVIAVTSPSCALIPYQYVIVAAIILGYGSS